MPQRGSTYVVPPRLRRPQRSDRWLVPISLGLDHATRTPRGTARPGSGSREDAERALEDIRRDYGICS